MTARLSLGSAPQRFAFQRLEVYQVAKAVAQLTIEHRGQFADVPGQIGERLARATVAVLAEIASGAVQASKGDQRRCYLAARAAANEAMSYVEVAQLHGMISDGLRGIITAQLVRVDAMLAGMIRRRSLG
jgi:four helix bundle protein